MLKRGGDAVDGGLVILKGACTVVARGGWRRGWSGTAYCIGVIVVATCNELPLRTHRGEVL